MAVVLKINGTDRSSLVKFGTLRISDKINQAADTCDFAIEQYGAQVFKPSVNDEVIVEVDAVRRYGGVIVEVEQSFDGHSVIRNEVKCKDYTQYMDRLLVTERYTNTTLQAVVQDLIYRYGSDYDFTDTNVLGSSVNIKSVSFNDIPLSECFNKLAKLTTYSWYVDYFKDVHFFKKNDEAAPFNLSDTSDNYIYDSLVISDDISQIRNKVKVRGGEAIAETRTEKLAGDGERDTFPLGNKFSSVPTVTVNGASKTVGIDFLNKDEDYQVMWSFAQKYLRFTAGNIPPSPSGGDTTNIDVTGDPLQPIVVQKQHNPSVAQYGVYEFLAINDSIRSRDEALQFAQAQLEAYAGTIKSGSFDTYEGGLKSGQTITINSTIRGLNEKFLIQSVTFRQVTRDIFLWHAELATLKTVTVIDILQELILRERLVEGEDETLLNFFALSDSFDLDDALGTITATTTEDYVVEQDDPGSDSYPNPAVINKSTMSS